MNRTSRSRIGARSTSPIRLRSSAWTVRRAADTLFDADAQVPFEEVYDSNRFSDAFKIYDSLDGPKQLLKDGKVISQSGVRRRRSASRGPEAA